MRRRNHKFCSTMILGAMAIFLVSSYNVHASEVNIYKCVQPSGRVVFQDSECAANETLEMHKVDINQSADTDIGLRAYELVVLSRIFQKQL